MNVLTCFGAYLRMVYEFNDTSFISVNNNSARAENLLTSFTSYISRMTESELNFMQIIHVVPRPHSDSRCILFHTTRPSLDVFTILAIHFFRRKTKMNRASKINLLI